jgi:hypothetical protein
MSRRAGLEVGARFRELQLTVSIDNDRNKKAYS